MDTVSTGSSTPANACAVPPGGTGDLNPASLLSDDEKKKKDEKKCTTCGDKDEKDKEKKEGEGEGTLKPGSSTAAAEGAPSKDVAGTGPADAMAKDSKAVVNGTASTTTNPDGSSTATAKGAAYAGGKNVGADNNYINVLGADGDITATSGKDGMSVTANAKGGLTEMSGKYDTKTTLGGTDMTSSTTGKLQVLNANGTGTGTLTANGIGGKGEVGASLARVEVNSAGKIGDVGTATNLEGAQVYAKADGQVLFGRSGTRTGIALGGTAEAGLVGGTVKPSITIPMPGGNSLTIGGEAGGVLGGGSIGAGGYAYNDSATGRTSVGLFAQGGAGVAAKLGLNFSYGPAVR